jgi:hypothetical protein
MDYEEFRRQLGKAGLTAKDFAELLKLNRNSISNYAQRGAIPTHLAVISVLLGEMAEHKIDFRGVLSRIEIAPNKQRGSAAGMFGGKIKTRKPPKPAGGEIT